MKCENCKKGMERTKHNKRFCSEHCRRTSHYHKNKEVYIARENKRSVQKYNTDEKYRAKKLIRNNTRYKHSKKGTCQDCGSKGKTQWHHIEYTIDSVIEICEKCHAKRHTKAFADVVEDPEREYALRRGAE